MPMSNPTRRFWALAALGAALAIAVAAVLYVILTWDGTGRA